MDEALLSELERIEKKGETFLDPSFFSPFSFEYAYRLLLVYLITKIDAVQEIRQEDPKAFDDLFVIALQKAIEGIAEYRGIEISAELRAALVELSNRYLVLFIKSACKGKADAIARDVAVDMEKGLLDCIRKSKNPAPSQIFIEPRD